MRAPSAHAKRFVAVVPLHRLGTIRTRRRWTSRGTEPSTDARPLPGPRTPLGRRGRNRSRGIRGFVLLQRLLQRRQRRPCGRRLADVTGTSTLSSLDPATEAGCDEDDPQPRISQLAQTPANSTSAQVLADYRRTLERLGWTERSFAAVGHASADSSYAGANFCAEIHQTEERTLTVALSVPASGYPFGYELDMIADTTGRC